MKPATFPLAQGVSITLKVNALHSQINVSKTSRGIDSLTKPTIGRFATRSKTKIAPAIIPTPNQVFTKKTVKEKVNVSVKPTSPEDLSTLLDKMTPEQIAALKEQLSRMEKEDAVKEKEDGASDANKDQESTDTDE